MDSTNFATGVISNYNRLGDLSVLKASSATNAYRSTPVGHPGFTYLKIGETAHCDLAVAFIDMRAMTARSFWRPLDEIARLSVAVLTQIAMVVEQSGGYVLGMRGDGLMAGWGDGMSLATADVAMCMSACAFSLDATEGALNNLLLESGADPVQLSAGADYGEVCFSRTGTSEASEVNVVGHPANFAAKCEKIARSWEVVVGEGAAAEISDNVLTLHEKSPKSYEYRGERRAYRFYDFAWRRIRQESATAIAQVAARPTSRIGMH